MSSLMAPFLFWYFTMVMFSAVIFDPAEQKHVIIFYLFISQDGVHIDPAKAYEG